jgi:hypothetical protein
MEGASVVADRHPRHSNVHNLKNINIFSPTALWFCLFVRMPHRISVFLFRELLPNLQQNNQPASFRLYYRYKRDMPMRRSGGSRVKP